MSDNALIKIESDSDTAFVTILESEELVIFDGRKMQEVWTALDSAKLHRKDVVVIRTPRDHMRAAKIDAMLQRARNEPGGVVSGNRLLPAEVAAAEVSAVRILKQLSTTRAMTVGVAEGEVDLDLLGAWLACKYRICSSDTVIVNHTLARRVMPGFATPWYLTRIIGRAKARKIYLNEDQLSAADALELGLVDEVVDASELDEQARQIAVRFSGADNIGLRSLMHSLNLTDGSLEEYLEEIREH